MNGLHHSAKNLTGQKIGRLTVVESTDKRHDGKIIYCCLCDCGNECFVKSTYLRNGDTKSCGCLSRELTKERSTTHGMRHTAIYSIWRNMLTRCENPKSPDYKNYGGRGIKVCERWHTFENFYADVGDPPEDMTLDRWPDNDGNYEPTNWRWATRSEQCFNSRPNSCGRGKQRWFYGYGPCGEMIIENSQKHVARIFGLCDSSISRCLYGKYKQTKNWTFQWLPS